MHVPGPIASSPGIQPELHHRLVNGVTRQLQPGNIKVSGGTTPPSVMGCRQLRSRRVARTPPRQR
jgi:hypothetical protein